MLCDNHYTIGLDTTLHILNIDIINSIRLIGYPMNKTSNTKENDITESENKAILIVGRRAAPK